jgi:rubrerythrin
MMYKCLKCGSEFDAKLDAKCPSCGAKDWDIESLRKWKMQHPDQV